MRRDGRVRRRKGGVGRSGEKCLQLRTFRAEVKMRGHNGGGGGWVHLLTPLVLFSLMEVLTGRFCCTSLCSCCEITPCASRFLLMNTLPCLYKK